MRYEEARLHINTGDMVAKKQKHGLFWWLVRYVTGSDYTHTATAVWCGNGLYVAEMSFSGNRIVPLSQWGGDFDVFKNPTKNRAGITPSIKKYMRVQIHYDFNDLFRIAFTTLLKQQLAPDRDGMVCSAFTANIYLDAGWEVRGLPSRPSPIDLVRAIGTKPKLEISSTLGAT